MHCVCVLLLWLNCMCFHFNHLKCLCLSFDPCVAKGQYWASLDLNGYKKYAAEVQSHRNAMQSSIIVH